MAKQRSYPMFGRVTFYRGDQASTSAAGVAGAKIWIWDGTEGTKASDTEQGVNLKGPYFTDDTGRYSINLANITTAYAQGDVIYIYCTYGRIATFTTTTVDINTGKSEINFALVKKSGLKDGLDNTVDDRGRFGLRQMGERGVRKGLKDGMQ